MAAKRIEFKNRTQGHLGVNKINRKGDEVALGVAPGAHVFLTQEEIALTEQAHANPESSPFRSKEIVVRDTKTGDEVERFVGAPLERVQARAPVLAD